MYLAAGYWRGRIQTTSMRVFDNLSDAWVWAQNQKKLMGNDGNVWEVSDKNEAKLLRPQAILKMLGPTSKPVI